MSLWYCIFAICRLGTYQPDYTGQSGVLPLVLSSVYLYPSFLLWKKYRD
jgi:hypothetical protein